MKINKKSVIDKTRRVLLVFLAAFIVIYSGFSGKVAADQASSGVSMENVRGKIMEEGKARVVANVLYKCFNLSYDSDGDGWNDLHEGEDVIDVGAIFHGWLTGTGMNGGAWYEKLQQGDVSDGYIDCTEKGGKDALQLFAEYTGVTVVDIICGENDTPGVFHNDGQAGKCTRSQVGKGKNDQAFVRDSNWESHLKKLYEDHATAEEWYDGRWSEIGNYDEYVGYGMYLQEIQVGCGSEVDASVSHSSNVLKYLDDTGAYIDKYISGNDSSYPVPTTNHKGNRYSFANWGTNKTCNQIIGRASELAPTVQTKMWELISQGCEEAYRRQKDAAQNIVDDPGASDSKKENAQKVIDEFNGLTSYTQDVKNEQNNIGKECIDVEYLMKPIQDDYDPYHDDPTQESTSDPNCYTNAGSLGWILCPIIESLGTFILEKYEQWIVPALQMDVALFSDNADNGTFRAWQVFRDIANVLFVILFLFVIFSQLTGVGIDNYGIKKILPKLIVGAILINLSYIICQLSIDVFNIMGRGIGSLFKGISDQLGPIRSLQVDNVTAPSSSWESFMSSGWNTVLVVIVGALGVAAVLSQGLAIIIPVLLLFISIAFSIFTLIAILGIRQAAAVLLVAVSPLAFACYMLPNTKPIFNKWFNFFKGLLMAFPVCSALIYGGDMAGKILLTTAGQNTWVIISAAVVSVAPIFFIPKVITGSLGAISGAIARFGGGLGHRAKGFAGGRLSNSFLGDRARYNQQMRQQKTMARIGDYNATRGRKLVDKYNKKGLSPSNMNSRQRRAYNSAMGAVNARNQEMENAYASDFAAKSDDDIQRELVDAAKSGKLDENMLTAGLGSINDNDQLTQTLNVLNGTEAGKKMLESATAQQRLAGVFRGKDDVINQSIGKLMAQGKTYEQMKADGSLAAKVQGAGVDVMKGINKDAFKIEGAADLFSDEQLRAAAAAGYTGKTAEEFGKMMEGVSSDRKENIVSGMTAEQVASLSQSSLNSLGGAETVKANAEDAINTLNSADGQNLRTKMDGNVMNQLGIKSGNSGDAASGGSGPAPSGNNGGGTGGGAPSSGGSNPPAKPVVAKVEGKAGTVNIREGGRSGEYKTDSGLILGGGTVDIRHNNNGGNKPDGSSSGGGIIIAR